MPQLIESPGCARGVLNAILTPIGDYGCMHRTGLSLATATRGRRRSHGRLDVRLHATIKTLSGSLSAILENISKKGAKLSVQAALREGRQVVVQWHGHEAFGMVAWSSSTHCGVTLSSELGEAVLRSTLNLNETFNVPEDDTDRLAARAWADGSARFGFD